MARVVMLAIGRMGFEEVEPVYVVRQDDNVWVLDSEEYFKKWRHNYLDVVEFMELKHDSAAAHPNCVVYFLSACKGMNSYGPVSDTDRRRTFDVLWDYLKSKQDEKKEKIMKIQNPACKALMLFGRNGRNDSYNINAYDHDVFVWNSVDGVRRMNFGEYLDIISAKHDATYALYKLERAGLMSIVQDDFDKFVAYCNTSNTNFKDMRAQMWFRSLWYAATGEVMSV